MAMKKLRNHGKYVMALHLKYSKLKGRFEDLRKENQELK
jgi:hypothetical protein